MRKSNWISNLVSKFLLEVVLLMISWMTYYIVRHILPKKFRMKDRQIHKNLQTAQVLLEGLPREEDQITDTFSRAKHVFEYFWSGRKPKSPMEEFKLFTRDLIEEYEIVNNPDFVNYIFPHMKSLGSSELMLGDGIAISKFEFNNSGENLYFVYAMDQEKNIEEDILGFFAVPKDFDYYSLTNKLFDIYGNRIYIHIKSNEDADDQIQVDKLEMDFNLKDYIFEEQLFNKLTKEINFFKNKEMQRTYLLCGPPGTGKTTWCLETSKRTSNKIVKIDSGFFAALGTASSKKFIESLKCDFIIVDDIDRIFTEDMPSFLYTLEAVKNFKNLPTLLLTANNIQRLDEALLRPGRIDQIISFKLPNTEERKEFIQKILAMFNVNNLTSQQLTSFVAATKDFSQSYIKEYCKQYAHTGNIVEVIESVKQRKQLMSEVEHDTQVEEEFFALKKQLV